MTSLLVIGIAACFGATGCASAQRGVESRVKYPVYVLQPPEIPPQSEAYLGVYYSGLSFYDAIAELGRPGPGIEFHAPSADDPNVVAVIFPRRGEPYAVYPGEDALTRFNAEWERINILQYSDRELDERKDFLMPFDVDNLKIISRKDGVERSIFILGPDYLSPADLETPPGHAIREVQDLVNWMAGELTL